MIKFLGNPRRFDELLEDLYWGNLLKVKLILCKFNCWASSFDSDYRNLGKIGSKDMLVFSFAANLTIYDSEKSKSSNKSCEKRK